MNKKRHPSRKKKTFRFRLCERSFFFVILSLSLGVRTPQLHMNEMNTKKTHRYRILSSIENIYFERKLQKKNFSLFTLEFVENEARRNKMFVSLYE